MIFTGLRESLGLGNTLVVYLLNFRLNEQLSADTVRMNH